MTHTPFEGVDYEVLISNPMDQRPKHHVLKKEGQAGRQCAQRPPSKVLSKSTTNCRTTSTATHLQETFDFTDVQGVDNVDSDGERLFISFHPFTRAQGQAKEVLLQFRVLQVPGLLLLYDRGTKDRLPT